MGDYLLGLATLPLVALVLSLLRALFHRGAASHEACAVPGCRRWLVFPQESPAPWWWWRLRWTAHKHLNQTHRAAWARHRGDHRD